MQIRLVSVSHFPCDDMQRNDRTNAVLNKVDLHALTTTNACESECMQERVNTKVLGIVPLGVLDVHGSIG